MFIFKSFFIFIFIIKVLFLFKSLNYLDNRDLYLLIKEIKVF